MQTMYHLLTRRQIADHFGLSELNVRDAMGRYGIRKPLQKRYRKWSPEEIDLIRSKYPTTSGHALAAEIGTTPRRVWAAVKRYGLMKQTRGVSRRD